MTGVQTCALPIWDAVSSPRNRVLALGCVAIVSVLALVVVVTTVGGWFGA